ncbi:hypothetical protein [Pseudooceanicola sp.]|uniref:hypothetical protein n=1 Tax=Pseudooceanicola sp. TaxID=1914328 RepID=UPI00405978AF
MPKRKTTRENFRPRDPGFLSPGELGTWLGVSRNSVADIAERFGLHSIEGRFPEAEVFRKILGIDPRDEQDRVRLRRPLEGARWLSRRTGVPASTVRAKIRKGTFGYPLGVQLSETSDDGAEPRSRRWLPCVIDAIAEGKAPPDFEQVTTEMTQGPAEMRGISGDPGAPNNVFARIARGNDQGAPQ